MCCPTSGVKNWFAGANPWHVSQNQGTEGKNKAIKKSYTFKTRVGIGKFFDIIVKMLRDWSLQDDSLLFLHRLCLLDYEGEDDGPRKNREGGLKLKTRGWKWSQKNPKKAKTNSVVKIERASRYGKFTVSEEAGLGTVARIWLVARETPRGDLTELAKVKLVERENPSVALSWDEKVKIKESCWILEERDGDFFCDCSLGFKGHLCDHTLGMHYRQETGRLEASEQVGVFIIPTK